MLLSRVVADVSLRLRPHIQKPETEILILATSLFLFRVLFPQPSSLYLNMYFLYILWMFDIVSQVSGHEPDINTVSPSLSFPGNS